MHYTITRFLIRIATYFFYRKKYLHHVKALDTGGPLLVCANHSNSFLDAMLIMVHCKRKFHVVVRADVFEKPWANFILRSFNLIPIYRIRDGFDQLEKNDQTFDECVKIFEKKGAIIIFPEAGCFSEKKLRKLQKGAAKIAFAAEDKNKFNLGLDIVSVGINYERLDTFGGYLHLRCAEPFPLSNYKDLFYADKNKAFREVTERIENEIEHEMIHFNTKEKERLFDQIVQVNYEISKDFILLKQLSQKVDSEIDAEMNQSYSEYHSLLKLYGLSHLTILEEEKSPYKIWAKNILRLVDAIVLFPIFVIGFLVNSIPFFSPYIISKKVFTEHREFDNSIVIAGSSILFVLSFIFQLIFFNSLFHSFIGALFMLGFTISSIFISIVYFREWRKLNYFIRFQRLPREKREALLDYASVLKEFKL